MASPQVENGYTRLANELLEALCRARLGGREMRVVLAVARLTYGYGEKEAKISLRRLSQLTGIPKEDVCKTLRRLAKKKVVSVRKEKGRLRMGIQKDYEKWGLAKAPIGKNANWQNYQRGVSKNTNSGVGKSTNLKSAETIAPQDIPGNLKKIYKENFKEISLERDPEGDVKEIVSSWEQAFQVSFPAPASQKEIKAADYMLWLKEQGRLPALRNPAAYLKKLAQTELESFPGLAERKRQAAEAKARMQKLAEREAELVLLRMKAEAEAEAEAKRRWSEMPPEAKMELLKEMKIRWPRQPTAFWERQAINQIKRQVLSSVWPDNRG